MHPTQSALRLALALGGLLVGIAPLSALAGTVTQTNILSDGFVPAQVTDPAFKNPWGIASGRAVKGPFWVSVNGSGTSGVIDATGAHVGPMNVSIPVPRGQTTSATPTGQVFNGSPDFVVKGPSGSGPALFLFATEDGTISGWSPAADPTHAILAVDNSGGGRGAVYKGLAIVRTAQGSFLLAANFRDGVVEVYDGVFNFVRAFHDVAPAGATSIPSGFGPFNVSHIGGHIFVTYAKQGAGGHDDEAGAGRGFVDEVSLGGKVLRRIASRGPLNSPWGLAIAPPAFGKLAGSLLVGNFGDGWIHAFSLAGTGTAKHLGPLFGSNGAPLAIDGLWGLIQGDGGAGGDPRKLYFAAGVNHEADGLFGSLTYVPSP